MTDSPSSFRPSTTLVVEANATILECLRKMRERKVGSIVVRRESLPHDLIGIFTERDLLMRYEELRAGANWTKPISTVMQHPVKTLSVYELDQAAELMVEKNIRHLPIVYEDETGEVHLAGIVSMRDLFKQYVQGSKEGIALFAKAQGSGTSKRRAPKLGFISKAPLSVQIGMRHLFSQGDRAFLYDFDMADLFSSARPNELEPPAFQEMDALIIDLDGHPSDLWARCLKGLFTDPNAPYSVVTFDPNKQEAKNVEVLKKLSHTEKFTVFLKPINLLEVLQSVAKGSSCSSE